MTLPPKYLPQLEALLAPTMRSAAAQQTDDFLAQSQAARHTLAADLARAQDQTERSRAEVQLLAAAAADLAVAQRLAGPQQPSLRSQTNPWPLLHTALTDPDALLRPTIRPARYRGADRDLLAATYQVLNSIQESAIETTADAITAALSMDMAMLRDAAKLAGLDIKKALAELGADEISTLAIESWQKMSLLIGEENMEKVQETMAETIEKLREKTAVSSYVEKFLATEAIYHESRAIIQAYTGPDKAIAQLTPQIIALQGSFAGRNKITASLTRLLSIAKLMEALRTPPWGPLIVASGYLLIIGYELYSAHDHVDSDKFPFFDRVAGVRTLISSIANPAN